MRTVDDAGDDPGMFLDLYRILDIPHDSDAELVRRGYKEAARRTHPDAGGSHVAFLMVALAHAVLSDDRVRAAYDVFWGLDKLALAAPSPSRTDGIESGLRRASELSAVYLLPVELRDGAMGVVDRATRILEQDSASVSASADGGPSTGQWGSEAVTDWRAESVEIMVRFAEFADTTTAHWPSLVAKLERHTSIKDRRRILFEVSICYHAITNFDKAVGHWLPIAQTPGDVLLVHYRVLTVADELIGVLRDVGEQVERNYSHRTRSYFARRRHETGAELIRRGLRPDSRPGTKSFSAPPTELEGRPSDGYAHEGSENAQRSQQPTVLCGRCGAPSVVGGNSCWRHSSASNRSAAEQQVGPSGCVAVTRSGSECRNRRSDAFVSCPVHRTTEGPNSDPENDQQHSRRCTECELPRLVGTGRCFVHGADNEFLDAHKRTGLLRCSSRTIGGKDCQSPPDTGTGFCFHHLPTDEHQQRRARDLVASVESEFARLRATSGVGLAEVRERRRGRLKSAAYLMAGSSAAFASGHPILGVLGVVVVVGLAVSMVDQI